MDQSKAFPNGQLLLLRGLGIKTILWREEEKQRKETVFYEKERRKFENGFFIIIQNTDGESKDINSKGASILKWCTQNLTKNGNKGKHKTDNIHEQKTFLFTNI